MRINVKHEELKNVRKVMKKDQDLLEIEINSMLKNLEELMTIWKGEDADKFNNNAYNYFTRMKILPEALETIGNLINKIDDDYIESDKLFSNELRKKVIKNE